MSPKLCCWRQTTELDHLLVCLNRFEVFVLCLVAASSAFWLACLYLGGGPYWTK